MQPERYNNNATYTRAVSWSSILLLYSVCNTVWALMTAECWEDTPDLRCLANDYFILVVQHQAQQRQQLSVLTVRPCAHVIQSRVPFSTLPRVGVQQV